MADGTHRGRGPVLRVVRDEDHSEAFISGGEALDRALDSLGLELPREAMQPVVLPAAARHAMTALEGKVNSLRRIFAGPSTTAAMAAHIEQLTNDIRTEAQRIARFSR